MANAEHLEILKSGVKVWNNWRKANTEITPDLSNEDLKFIGGKISRLDFSRSNLSGSNLHKVNLHQANLEGANLKNCYLALANFNFSYMHGADFTAANLIGAGLYHAMLTECDFSNAVLVNCNFTKAHLSNSNLTKADLEGANLTGAQLDGVNFSNCNFGETLLNLTDLSGAKGLDSTEVKNHCGIDFYTLSQSKNIPKSFLLKIGLTEHYIDYLPDFYTDTLTLFPAFISHSKANREFARKLYEALIAKGVTVFFDEKQLKPGDSLVKTISKGINHYDKTILVCSKESLASTWVDYELELVLKKELVLMEQKETDEVGLLIPITIDNHIFSWNGNKEWIKDRFIGDFREWQDSAKFERALNELIQALNIKRLDIKPPTHL